MLSGSHAAGHGAPLNSDVQCKQGEQGCFCLHSFKLSLLKLQNHPANHLMCVREISFLTAKLKYFGRKTWSMQIIHAQWSCVTTLEHAGAIHCAQSARLSWSELGDSEESLVSCVWRLRTTAGAVTQKNLLALLVFTVINRDFSFWQTDWTRLKPLFAFSSACSCDLL